MRYTHRIAFLVAWLFALSGSFGAQAAVIMVNTKAQCGQVPCAADGDNLCSLGEAIVAANTDADVDGCDSDFVAGGADTIFLSGGIYELSVADNQEAMAGGANGFPSVMSEIYIFGNEQNPTSIARSGVNEFRFFKVDTNGRLTLKDVILTNGNVASGGAGAAIFNGNKLDLTRVTFSNNVGFHGGGAVANKGTLTVLNSSFVNNKSLNNYGGAISCGGTGNVTVKNTTFYNNSALNGGAVAFLDSCIGSLTNATLADNKSLGGGLGGGVYNVTGALTIANTVLTGNSSPNGPGCYGALLSGGYNLMGVNQDCPMAPAPTDLFTDAKLGAFKNHSMPGKSHIPPAAGSPLIDKGSSLICVGDLLSDQTGKPRLGACDIGAAEFDPSQDDGDPAAGDECGSECQSEPVSPTSPTNPTEKTSSGDQVHSVEKTNDATSADSPATAAPTPSGPGSGTSAGTPTSGSSGSQSGSGRSGGCQLVL